MKHKARLLRQQSTKAEHHLWQRLRRRQLLGLKFRRQVVIGKYIVDFFCFEKGLIIEVDGSQHMENVEYDELRTQCLERKGYEVIRFWNNEVLNNIEAVLEQIYIKLNRPSPRPSPRGRG